MHSDQKQDSRDSNQPLDADGLEKDRVEKRAQRDQEERSKQALSNQGSQDRKRGRARADQAGPHDGGDGGK